MCVPVDKGLATMETIIIATEQLPNQEYGQRLEVVLGKQQLSEDDTTCFYTGIRRGSKSTVLADHWSRKHGLTLIQATVDFETRLRGTGHALNMLFNQIREVKQ